FAVIGTHDALTLKNVVHVSAYEPYVIKAVGEEGSPPHGLVAIELFRGEMPIPQKKMDVLSAFFMHGLQQLLGRRWARGFAVIVSEAGSLADSLGGYQEDILRQALQQPLTGVRKVTFERRRS
ncbi:MAG: hypothetical protein JXA10_07700, partial [Anaerolineae bacterium]|nr:hypothetical protein [Anaerolineae bacterium]